MKNRYLILACFGMAVASVRAETFNNVSSSGNVVSTGGNIVSQVGFVKGQTYLYTPGYLQADNYVQGNVKVYSPGFVQAGNYVYAGTYVYAASYLQAAGAGYFGDFLRVGGATNTPASKSVQIGPNATASSYCSLVVGQYNVIEGTAGSWNGTPGAKEPLLVVANGADTNNKNNAFAVYKDGTVTMSKAQGDILMGQFGN
jgi:hypothetical protein